MAPMMPLMKQTPAPRVSSPAAVASAGGAGKPGAMRVRGKARSLLSLRPKTVWKFLNDSKAPLAPKLALVAAVAYLILPVDLIPEVPLLFVGLIDDLGLMGIAITWLAQQVAAYDYEEENRALPVLAKSQTEAQEVVEGEIVTPGK